MLGCGKKTRPDACERRTRLRHFGSLTRPCGFPKEGPNRLGPWVLPESHASFEKRYPRGRLERALQCASRRLYCRNRPSAAAPERARGCQPRYADAWRIPTPDRTRIRSQICVDFASLSLGRGSHLSMLEEPGEQRALLDALPVQGGLMNQEMEEGIVRSGNRAPQAGLARLFLLPFRKMLSLLQQVIGISHRGSCPSRVVNVG
jgi:hypothetical protein